MKATLPISEAETFQHQLQKFDPGIIWLDSDSRVISMNTIAIETLGSTPERLIGRQVLNVHPEKSRNKVSFLLEASNLEPSTPPITMMINIPDRVLLIKTSKMLGADSESNGACMVFYDVTDVTTHPISDDNKEGKKELRKLFKLPVFTNNRVMLLELESVIYLQADGHYTRAHTNDKEYLCNLSLADLEKRTDHSKFIRIHRSFTVNLKEIKEFKKENDRFYVVMDNDSKTQLPISRNNVQELKKILGID